MNSRTPAERERRSALVVCLLVAALATLDISKVNVAIPAIEEALGAGPAAVQLISAGYVLAFGLALVPAGRFGDLRSRRSMFIAGMVVFGIASVACAAAPNPTVLVAARVLEGIAAGMIMPQTLGLIQQLFTGEERGRAFGLFGTMIGLTVAVAPPLGGALVALGGSEWGWRMVFLVNIPILLVCFPLALKYLPRHQAVVTTPRHLDPLGITLLAATAAALMLPFVLTTGTDNDDPRRWLFILVAGAVGMAFVFWERRYVAKGRTPVIDLALLAIPAFRHGVLIAFLYYGGAPACVLTTTLFYQHALGMSALFAGLAVVPFALAYIGASWWSGRATHRLGRPLVIGGLVVALAGWCSAIGAAIWLPVDLALLVIPMVLALAGAGAGSISAPNQTLTLHDVPPSQGGLAGSIAQMAQRIGAAMGVAIAMSVFYGTISAERLALGRLAAYQDAYRNAVLACLGLVLAAIMVAVLDERWRRRAKPASAASQKGRNTSTDSARGDADEPPGDTRTPEPDLH